MSDVPCSCDRVNLNPTTTYLPTPLAQEAMQSEPTPAPSTQITTSQILFDAETKHLLGRFRVDIGQLKPHPSQRQQSHDWVTALYNRFVELGVDRAAYPIKITIPPKDRTAVHQELMAAQAVGRIAQLPSGITGLVYQGQHRIAACEKLADRNEHWWFAEVYSAGARYGVYVVPKF